ncbi:hypothetical protein RGQ13_18135 [Thalassotalea psychrophila]|uniref:Transposon Tn7 transposition protein TnsD C-termianl domain-containing protein n=1 Tax=Thalassotalea psychrophila TaxID=3065647 RepID=A0ABY9TT62_9GAMM|nr:hypothetical protein RGQ13_18135 [Colwelliaceae bacterium SQ149]
MHKRFTVRPIPYSDESFIGFVLRVAKVNGYKKLSHIFGVIDLPFLITTLEISSNMFQKLINKLAPFLLLKPDALFKQFSETQCLYFDEHRGIKKINLQAPHICISCFQAGDAYLKQDWQLAHHTHCEVHCSQLQSACPCCKTSFTWNTYLFDGCAKCGLRWVDVSMLNGGDIPLYQAMLNRLTGMPRENYLRGLYKALIHASRPSDYLTVSLNRFPELGGCAHKYFDKAYALLSAPAFRQRTKCELNHHLASHLTSIKTCDLAALNYPACNLSALQLPYNDDDSIEPLPAQVDFLPKIIRKNLSNKLVAPVLSLLSDEQAAKLIGLTPSQLNELARNKGIESIINSSQHVYSLNQVDNWLTNIIKTASPSVNINKGLSICINEIDKLGEKYLCSFAETFSLLLREKLPLFDIEKNNKLTGIYVNRLQLQSLLQENTNRQFNTLLSKSVLSKFFCIREHKISLLAKVFEWESVAVNRVKSAYKPQDIKSFFESHIVLDKWCEERVYPKSSLYQYLNDHNVRPVANTIDERWVLHVFEKSAKLFQVIDSFEKDWLKSKAPRHLPYGFNKIQPNFYKQASSVHRINHEMLSRQFPLTL